MYSGDLLSVLRFTRARKNSISHCTTLIVFRNIPCGRQNPCDKQKSLAYRASQLHRSECFTQFIFFSEQNVKTPSETCDVNVSKSKLTGYLEISSSRESLPIPSHPIRRELLRQMLRGINSRTLRTCTCVRACPNIIYCPRA